MMKADIERFSKEYAAEEPAEGRLARVLQVDVPAWRELGNEILADLDEHAFGVRWWAPHPGTTRRILISDHLFTCVTSVESNLIEARLHLTEAMDFWQRYSDFHARAVSVTKDGRCKVQLPPRRCPLDELTPAMSMLHTVGFIRAIAGALDCFGASVVGVAALKTSLLRADLDLARRALDQVTGVAAGDRIQADVRAQLEALIERVGPPGWFRWTIDLRNTLIHRGRRLQLSELRPIPSGLVDSDGVPIIRTDVIHQLPRDPGSSDVEMFLDTANPPVLTKTAAATLRGVLEHPQPYKRRRSASVRSLANAASKPCSSPSASRAVARRRIFGNYRVSRLRPRLCSIQPDPAKDESSPHSAHGSRLIA